MNKQEFNRVSDIAYDLGFLLSYDQFGCIYRECRYCDSVTEFSSVATVDLTPCRCQEVEK